MDGWICLHRSILNHHYFSVKPVSLEGAWIRFLLLAAHKETSFMLKGRAYKLQRGQLAYSQIGLQNMLGWSQNKVKRFLNMLKNERAIDYKTDDATTIITICNYDKYQDLSIYGERATNEHTNEPRTNRERTTNEPRTTYNNDNHENHENHLTNTEVSKHSSSKLNTEVFLDLLVKKNEKVAAKAAPAPTKKPSLANQVGLLVGIGLCEDIAKDFVVNRRKPVTKTVCDILARESAKAGIGIDSAAEICIARGWENFNASWEWQRSKKINGIQQAKTFDQIRREETEKAMEAFLNRHKTIEGEVLK